ncbi:MAG: anaerobic ribonucleoside-triphosphate reductase activating protein [Muribaculaceae bacterium]|nr:anaerobic ribonucleoside-triphosphate reductase activating protein [Muribaculaceae bacterium]
MLERINILDIIRGTTVDGPGFRTSIYISGCRHRCHGCHNPESWSFELGNAMSLEEIMDIVKEEDFDVTLSGGDPLYHPDLVAKLCDEIHKLNHTVWLYTGFTWEEIMDSPILLEAIKKCDVIVDSPFILELMDTDLLFRGSSNQRIIDVKRSMDSGEIILWHRS